MGLDYITYGIFGLIVLLLLAWRFQGQGADTYGSAGWLSSGRPTESGSSNVKVFWSAAGRGTGPWRSL